MKKFLFFIFFIVYGVFPQTVMNYPEIGYEVFFNFEDFMMGIDAQLPVEWALGKDYGAVFFSVDWRPKGTRILVPAGNNLYYQYWEKKTLLNLGISEEVTFVDWAGAYGKFFTGISFHSYRGLEKSKSSSSHWGIEGGFLLRTDNEGAGGGQINIGARYFKFRESNVFPLYLLVRIALLFPK